ncbi:hypothetical protein TCAL_00110 [Tigriopus californicus]|uniref:Rab-GAP TBC domain-containing protein n=1 Tax=Tigriopus californicus TaxID=6832 RepID=A0A553PFY1_TIGCA|nr:TBC1 domain family member 25-like [Tigriopus californicus]TRY76589.1 hypothetical protein TCAL_00110 [Tigriopus californicus]|eukprot:TCALIF_00110-PA protein Name:"Similar to TBC1D25 TBC1 domain family member 25 (Homo sapiens)" AED:0.01 eAED:0.01 QI:999/1/1/1/0/0/2/187/704
MAEPNPAMFEYDCEAVRVRAKRINPSTGTEEMRKFSVDPNLTSYDILRSILGRAFDISDQFLIFFLSGVDWLPLISDWDLDIAILSAAEPSLLLLLSEVSPKKLAACEPTIISTTPTRVRTSVKASGSRNAGRPPSGAESLKERQPSPILASLRQQMERNLPGLSSRLHKAMTMAEEVIVPKGQQLASLFDVDDGSQTRDPASVSDQDFGKFLNKVGELSQPKELRLAVFQSGIEPPLRKVLWKHLLGVYPNGLTGRQRVDFIKQKCAEYECLKNVWMEMILQGRVTDDLKHITNMVKKDVLRTDRHAAFFAGEGNPNVSIMYNILTTYALNHPSVGYCQGMSDLLSPIMAVMIDEGQAYVSFCALMTRLKSNFMSDGKAMTKKFEHLSQSLLYYDPEFFYYLKQRHADDLLYCYRWLVLEMKREFSFEDAFTVAEVIWASLPPCHANNIHGVQLYEHRFVPKDAKNVVRTPNEGAMANIAILKKRLHQSDSRGFIRNRIKSADMADDEVKATRSPLQKSLSLMSGKYATNHEKEAPDKTHESENKDNSPLPAKKITNLNEFYQLKTSVSESEALKDVAGMDLDDSLGTNEALDAGEMAGLLVKRLPSPIEFGDGNPFLMFVALSCILQHRDAIMEQQLDYQEIAMYFDRLIRRHDVKKSLKIARVMFSEYLNDDWQQKKKQDGSAMKSPSTESPRCDSSTKNC